MVTTTEFDQLIEVLRDFIRSEVMPAEAGIDESDEIPARLIAQAKEMGLYGYALPAEYGGLKRYITNAPAADVFMVFARTDPQAPAGKGIGVFIVPARADGVAVAARDHKMGQAGAWTADVAFTGVRVPRDALVGEAAQAGYATAMRSLAHGRLVIAAMCVGVAARLIDESVGYARERSQGGHPIGEYQLVQAMLADSQTEYLAARALVLDAAVRYDAGTDRRLAPSAAKYFASEAVGRIADRAVQIHGGSGYIRGVPVERLYRDVRLFRIYEGTSQIQQLVIAREMLR